MEEGKYEIADGGQLKDGTEKKAVQHPYFRTPTYPEEKLAIFSLVFF